MTLSDDLSVSDRVDHALVAEVRRRVGVALDGIETDRDPAEARQRTLLEIGRQVQELNAAWIANPLETPLSLEQADQLRRDVFNLMNGLGRIEDYIESGLYSDIVMMGCDQVKGVRRDGGIDWLPAAAASDEDLVAMVTNLVAAAGSAWDTTRPDVDVAIGDGHRLHAIGFGLADRPTVTVRIVDWSIFRLTDLLERGMVSRSLYGFLASSMTARHNIYLSGGPGAGKTTCMRCLINELPPERHKITIEDTPELGLKRWPDRNPSSVELVTRLATVDGHGGVDMVRLLRNTLRMKPDHIIVGEFRGPEAVEALQAMNTGARGTLSSLHAESAHAVPERLQHYTDQAGWTPERTNRTFAKCLDFIVHVAEARDGTKVINSVIEVTGVESDGSAVVFQDVYMPDETGRAVPTNHGATPDRVAELVRAGFDPNWLLPENGGWDR